MLYIRLFTIGSQKKEGTTGTLFLAIADRQPD
jgi:hypothetical protein